MGRAGNALVLAVVCLAVVAGAVPAAADDSPPPPPAAYYGSLTVNGEPARAGVTVTAEIDGEVRGSLVTEREGAFGGPDAFDAKLQVDGADGDAGATVTFYVNGVRAAETATWQSGDVRRVDLAVSGNVYRGGAGSGGGGGGSGGGQPAQGTETPTPGGDDSGVERVDVTVSAQAGETASVNLTDAPDGDGDGLPDVDADRNVTLDGLDVEFEQDGDVSLEITSSDRPLADDAPSLALDGTEPLGYVRVDHSVPEDAIGNVTFRFRVSKARLAERGADPSNVAMYRHHDGSWSELPTRQVGETATHYVVAATSPGLSDFATGLKRPTFRLTGAELSAASALVGDEVEVRVRVENVGGADGTYLAELRLDGEVVASQEVAVAAGDARLVTFRHAFDREGTYRVAVGDAFAGEVSVAPATATGGGQPEGTTTLPETESPGLDGFGVGVALLAVGSLALLARRR